MRNNLKELLDIPTINENRHYWMIRTSGGAYYDDFILHQYIAIAWDYISIGTLSTQPEENVKTLIESSEKANPTNDEEDADESKRTKVTTIYNKLHKFIFDLKEGDIVLIPNKNSDLITIAELEGAPYEDTNYVDRYIVENQNSEITPCPYNKRRHIKTLKTIAKHEMDIYLAKGFNSQHALSSLDDSAEYINRTLYQIYEKGNEMHTTIYAGHPNGLTLKELTALITYLDSAMDDMAEQCYMPIEDKDLEVKLNIHSPGLIEMIGYGASAGAVITMLMFSINNLINGGKFKASLKRDMAGQIDFSIESESDGIRGNNRKDQELKLKQGDLLLKMVKELDIKSPEIISAMMNGKEITEEMVSNAIEKKAINELPNKTK